MYATDRQTSDAHHRLMPPPYGGGGIITPTVLSRCRDDDHRVVHRLLDSDARELMRLGVDQSPITEADLDFL